MRCDVTSLAGLPPEAVLRIIYFMQPLDMLRLACTCTALRDTILDEGLWARLCRSRWYRFAHANSAPCAPSWRHLFFGGNNWDESELLSSVVRQYDDFHAIEFEPPSSQAAGSTLLTATRTWPANRVTVEAFEPTVDSAGKCRGMRQTFRTSLPPSFAVHGLTRLEHEKVLVSTSAIGGGAALAVLQNHQGYSSDHVATVAGLAAQPLESPGAAAHSSQAWGFTARRTGRASGVVAVDLETHTATSCHDLMSYSFCAWCKHPVDEQARASRVRQVQAAVALAYAEDSTCRSCADSDRPSLCEHTGSHPCVLSIVDMRTPRATDRCPLGHSSCFPRLCPAEGRPPYLFTSHGRAAICAWDMRMLTYPVHEERLDHCIDVPHLRLPRAARRSHGQGVFLSSHSDFVIGQAGNGMTWVWDLSDKLGWARDPHRRGCWRSFRSSSDAKGDWRHPTPLGVVPHFDPDTQAIFAIPEAHNGAFLAVGVSPPSSGSASHFATSGSRLEACPAAALSRWPEQAASWTRSPDGTESVQLFCLADST